MFQIILYIIKKTTTAAIIIQKKLSDTFLNNKGDAYPDTIIDIPQKIL